MRNRVAQVKNIRLLFEACLALKDRSSGLPGIGLVWGATGYGKTTAAAHFTAKTNAVYVRACSTWTPSAMLSAICHELDAQPMGRNSAMLEYIVEQLATRGRPLIVDEGDYLVAKKVLLETLRDLHDLSTAPLIVIGMADFRRKVVHREQFAGRIAQWIEFKAAEIEDARVLAETVCEVSVDDELLEKLHRVTQGSMRLMSTGLERIERWARRTGKDVATLADWGDQPFTFVTA